MCNLLHRCTILKGRPSNQAWDWVLDEPLLTAFLPALYYAAKDDALPLSKAALQRARLAYYSTAAANLLRYRELGNVLGAFNDAGVPTIVLKGAVLAEDLYPSIGLRPMSDVDILVPRDRVPDARRVLEQLGYQPEAAVLTPWGSIDQITKSIGMFTKETEEGNRTAVVIDLHWDLINIHWLKQVTRLEMADLWNCARPIQLSGQPTHQLCPEDTLLHLCIHQALKHHLIDLKDYLDMDQLVRSRKLDWETFVARAQAVRLRVACYHALHFTQTLFCTPIPDGVMAALRPDLLRRWLVHCFVTPEKRLLNHSLTISVPLGFLLNLLMVDRWRDLARVGLAILWPDAQWLTQRHRMAGAGRLHPCLWHLSRLVRYVLALLKCSPLGTL